MTAFLKLSGGIATSVQESNGSNNYISFNNFENNATTGWSLGTTGTITSGLPTGTPTFGSGASGNLSISVVSSGQLSGSYSLSYASSAATTQGNMLASQAYSTNASDKSRVLTYKFNYKVQSGSGNANFAGTSSSSFGVAIYDVTNSTWLTTSVPFCITQASGVGQAIGVVQLGSSTASIRLVIYNANASSGAVTLYFDDFSLTPQASPEGVCAHIDCTSGPTVNTSDTLIIYNSKAFDTHGAFNTSTGLYTVAVPGKYEISHSSLTNAVNLSTSQGLNASVYKNGAFAYFLGVKVGTGASTNHWLGAKATLQLQVGDTLGIYLNASVSTSLVSTTGYNYVEIRRVGD